MFILRRIHAFAATSPQKLALVHNGAPLSFGAFWRLIEACRRDLEPVLPASGVALLRVGNIRECWIFELALRSLGLDTAFVQTTEQAALFEGAACCITLASESGAGFAPPAGVPHLRLADPSAAPISEDDPVPPLPEIPAPGGYIVLTSGTTGRYKKVRRDNGLHEDTFEGRRGRYEALGDGFRQQGDDTILNVFDLGLWTAAGHSRPIFTWSQGGAVVIQQGPELQKALDWPGITHTLATPIYLTWLMALPEDAFSFQPGMQIIVVAGAVTPALARETLRRLGPRMIINLSSTEAGGWARTVVESEEDLRWYRLDPDRRVEVVDDAGEPLPIGSLGRVRVAVRPEHPDRYLDDPEASAAFFGDGWWYSGDLGVLDGAGRLALYGRTTDIVHINGDKYPAEPWERAIQEKLGCEGVCILSGRLDGMEEKLHVFLELRQPVARATLEEAMRSTLWGFADVHIHPLTELPRTPLGKIKRLELAQRLRTAAGA